MTKEKLKILRSLLLELQEERLNKYRNEGYDIDSMDDEEITELDDGDNLLQGIDTTYCVVEQELSKETKPTLEEIKRVLQYLDEELLVEGTFAEVCDYVKNLK